MKIFFIPSPDIRLGTSHSSIYPGWGLVESCQVFADASSWKMRFDKMILNLIVILLTLQNSIEGSLSHPEVEDLQAVADYHAFLLTWKFPLGPRGQFVVRYCEVTNTLWQHCNKRAFNESEIDVKPLLPSSGAGWRFSVLLDGLRLGSAYEVFVVTKAEDEDWEVVWPRRPRRWLRVSTKGFVAKVTRCLPEFTEVLVDTGPYFKGRVEVEGAVDARCKIEGDVKNPRTQYVFVITHELCGSLNSGHYVQNVIVVNESPSLITHSSRRFNLVCDLLPDPFTLQATINLTDGAPVREDAEPDMILERTYEDALYETRNSSELSPVVAVGLIVVLLVIGTGAGFAWATVRRWKRHESDPTDNEAILPTTNIRNVSSTCPTPRPGGQIALMAHRQLEQI